MSKFVNVAVSTTLSTDFFIEVPDNATEEQIKELAEKQIILPHTYPKVLDNFLKQNMGINVRGIDSMLKDWNVDDLSFVIDNEETDSNKS